MEMDNPILFVSQVGDTMHLHQALKEPDRAQFLKAMMEEVTTHERHKHWKLCPIQAVPKRAQRLKSMLSKQCKRCIGTGEFRSIKHT